MKTIILYKSATGFTKRYADWICESIDCESVSLKEASIDQLSGYDTIIFGSRIHAGRIDGLDKVRKLCATKKLILFVTGGTPAEATAIIDKMWTDNLTPEELKTIPHFYMPGGLCYEKMSVPDRLLMKMAAKMMGNGGHKDSVEAGFAQALTGSYDISDKKYIEQLISDCFSLC